MALIDQINKEHAKIARAQTKITELRASCPHNTDWTMRGKFKQYPEYVKSTPGSNTGNWCSADDTYWTEYECANCGQKWTEYK